ncbi:hypothetical protein QVD17_07154 [Tagetes erecta]|uniref:Uncharacterized protein n=1 Tax=Tagetes erecta TaxID=13708 RepID=A0AAD8LGY0_TARER|nr:hypothetical protein QVD17_07154 [Tagetes erecta]
MALVSTFPLHIGFESYSILVFPASYEGTTFYANCVCRSLYITCSFSIQGSLINPDVSPTQIRRLFYMGELPREGWTELKKGLCGIFCEVKNVMQAFA